MVVLRRCRRSIIHSMFNFNAAKLGFLTQPRTIASPIPSHMVRSNMCANPRPLCTMNTNYDPQLDKIFDEKRSLRTQMRRELKKMDPIQRSQEEGDAQIKKKLYVPRVEDRNSNMRMLKISSIDDLVLNSMNILEPTLVDCNGNPREDVMEVTDPVDLIILPGLAFDRSGRRLGRSGGYYDVFLKKYQELVKKQNWKQPLLVALSYSIQITENERIAVTPYDVPVDALVSPSGFIPSAQLPLRSV